jgi:hypothetical protein
MPGMAHGFGYPHFNYYAPLASYVLIALHTLGLIYPAAFNLFLFLCVWLAGLATYALVQEWWGPAAGLVAAILYLTAPYLGFDVMVRGALAEVFGLAWPPIILWLLHRALALPAGRERRWSRGISAGLAALAFAGLIYAHNATALAVAPLIGGYVILLAWLRRRWTILLRGGGILAVGLALSARFWLPALAERSLVQSDRLLVAPIFTYYTNFLSLRELLAWPSAVDPLLINPSPAKGLGLLAFVLAGAGCAALLWTALNRVRRGNTPHRVAEYLNRWDLGLGAFFSAALLGYMLLTLAPSRPVWDNVPLLPFIQFPWRFLGAAALCAAVLGGAIVHWLPRQPWLAAAGLVLVITAGHWSWWTGQPCGVFEEITQRQTVAFELTTHTIGTTAKGEFLPSTVNDLPADLTIAQALIHGEQPRYLTGLPEGARVTVTNSDVLDYRATVVTPLAFTVTFNQFFFPGWRAAVDDQPAAIVLTPATGLMTVALPAGTHTLSFHFGDTPVRAVSDVLSLAAFISLLTVALGRALRDRRSSALRQSLSAYRYAPLNGWEIGILAAGLALALARWQVLEVVDSPLRHSVFDGATVRTAQHPFPADFEGGVRAYGYDLSSTTVPADGFVDVSLYVSVREHVSRQYWPAFTIKDAAGLTWNNPNALPPRWHKEPPDTQYWDPDSYAQWARHLLLDPGTPPGQYEIWGEVFDKQSKQIASRIDGDGAAREPRFSLGPLSVTRPAQPFSLTPEIRAPHAFGPIALLGYNINRNAANAGDSLQLDLYWRSETATETDVAARAGLLKQDGTLALTVDLAPVTGYPTSAWHLGDEWRGRHRLQLPATLDPGYYQLFVSVGGDTLKLGQIKVFAPPHSFTRPAVDLPAGTLFADTAALEGFSLIHTPGVLNLTLVWRATASPAIGYSAFIHLVDDAGRVWAQSDTVPANWLRPVTGWIPGEYISDPHTLALPADLPAGVYHLFVGLYDPETNQRVPTSGPGAAPDNRAELTSLRLP